MRLLTEEETGAHFIMNSFAQVKESLKVYFDDYVCMCGKVLDIAKLSNEFK